MNDPDTYGKYIEENGRWILTGTDPEDERREYAIRPGTTAIAEDAFDGQPNLEKLILPASLECIPEGSLSNGGGWASDQKGISEIEIDPENTRFVQRGCCFCEKQPDGGLKLLCVTGKDENVTVPAEVTVIGKNAFYDCPILSVYLEEPDVTIWFPKDHGYYLKKLLEGFGKNGKLYDFTEYDRFLCGDRFNPQRIRMIRGRVCSGYDLAPETADQLKENMRLHEEEVFEGVADRGSEETLEDLAASDFFTEENIDRFTDRINRTDRKDLLVWLMNYKNSRFKNAEFDFSI